MTRQGSQKKEQDNFHRASVVIRSSNQTPPWLHASSILSMHWQTPQTAVGWETVPDEDGISSCQAQGQWEAKESRGNEEKETGRTGTAVKVDEDLRCLDADDFSVPGGWDVAVDAARKGQPSGPFSRRRCAETQEAALCSEKKKRMQPLKGRHRRREDGCAGGPTRWCMAAW